MPSWDPLSPVSNWAYGLIGSAFITWAITQGLRARSYKRRYGEEHRKREDFERELKELKDRISASDNLWLQAAPADAAEFVPAAKRKCLFLSIFNLKGGVGKTTVAASLAYTLAMRGRRVLLLDLDFQSTLSRLCASPQDLDRYQKGMLTCDQLLSSQPQETLVEAVQRIKHRFVHVPNDSADLIVARRDLANIEFREQARWVAQDRDDVRFRLRKALHAPTVADDYDWVIFDCPPRLSTACMNALACSDYLLIPVQLDRNSVRAMPETLHWIDKLAKANITQAKLLGVVANQAKLWGAGLVKHQRPAYAEIPIQMKAAGYPNGHVFKTLLKHDRVYAVASEKPCPAAAISPTIEASFKSLVQEIEARIK